MVSGLLGTLEKWGEVDRAHMSAIIIVVKVLLEQPAADLN